jgi:hypothetical protein
MAIELGSPVIAHAIQFAVAPVFLLTGIAGLLGVMTNRLARVIDRARALEQAWKTLDDTGRDSVRAEIRDLEKRRKLASRAINFCTSAALLVCILIAALFIDEFFGVNIRWLVGALFVAAMIAVIGGLASFLREVWYATNTMHFDVEKFLR